MSQEFSKRGVEEIIEEKSFFDRIGSGKKLRIKYGVDPTRPDIHLGHTVALLRLKELQSLGHTVIFLIGDYTTKIGDPSGRNSTRPILTDDEIKSNAKTYLEQVNKVLDIDKTEVRYNSEWLSKLTFADLLKLAGKFTVAQIIERDDFEKRMANKTDIGLHELLYPIMQAYDSVVLKADVEFGGTDQKFNMLAGRDLQKKMEQKPQDVVIVKLLVGLDGKIKMSKSADNYIAIMDSPAQMFGKIMSIPDSLIVEYFNLCTDASDSEIKEVEQALEKGDNPRDIKMRLAAKIVSMYHSDEAAEQAKDEFVSVFSNKELPTDIPEVKIDESSLELLALVMKIGSIESASEARRLIEQGGVRIDEEKMTDPKANIKIKSGMIVKIGKLKVYKVKSL